ncbi:hypothetical protein [Magnetospirillum sp. UT-4]|uniref:hypothetical protein n=1 Tax=Magnetospirillum sp. UT-4 TaxID=2681467 RepID=UPI0015719DF5|nr:hypothetical protein [Magnetospirillum sp. UT-4]
MELQRATAENRLFEALEKEWGDQLGNYEAESGEYDQPYMDHARKIMAESPSDPRYGIYIVLDTDSAVGTRFKGMVHVNHAWPNTPHATLRMVWIMLAPQFDFADVDPDEVGDIIAALLYGGVELCQADMRSVCLKMHLGNYVDRQFAVGLARGLSHRASSLNAAVKGNWLHLENVTEGVKNERW